MSLLPPDDVLPSMSVTSHGQAVESIDPLSWLDDIAQLHVQRTSSGPAGSPGSYNTTSSSRVSVRPPSNHPQDPNEGEYNSSSSSGSSVSTGAHRAGKKARLALDPSQDPTNQGKSRARVYIACHEW